jgi:hypothetical protein
MRCIRALLSPEDGAKTSIYLASSPELAGTSGKYFSDCKEVAADGASDDLALARALWDKSAQLSQLG